MSFNIPIEVGSVTIETNNVTLTSVSCYNGADDVSSVFWNTTNSNLDSSAYCVLTPAQESEIGFCNNVTSGVPNFFGNAITIFVVLGMVILMGFLFFVVRAIKGEEDYGAVGSLMESIDIKLFMILFFGVGLIAYIMVVLFGLLCSS